ncbi:MAG: hypothetical protein HYS12_07375 [Planctomycetes bacterium]|nr:hypothetical protein [Planctomycetota bacterium]
MTTLLPEMIRRSIDPLEPLLSGLSSGMTEERARSVFEAYELLVVSVEKLIVVSKRWLSGGAAADTARALMGEVADTARALLWAVGEFLSRRDDVPDFPERDEGFKAAERLKVLAETVQTEASDVLRRLNSIRPLRPAPGLLDALQAQGPEKFTRYNVVQPGQEKTASGDARGLLG